MQNLTVALQDVGGNSLPLPAGSFFVLIDALAGSSARVTACERGPKQLAVSRSGNQLKVAPFLVVSTAAGQAVLKIALRSIHSFLPSFIQFQGHRGGS